MRVLGILLFATCMAWGSDEKSAEIPYPFPLFEIAPQFSFLQQTYPVDGSPSSFYANSNIGVVLRFTPVWKKTYPLLFHFGTTQLWEQSNANVGIVGEHNNLKYIWSWGIEFGFFPVEGRRWMGHTGFDFSHVAFLRDTGGEVVALSKLFIPAIPIGLSYEWWRSPSFSSYLEAGVRADISVPVDIYYLLRNGIMTYVRGTARLRMETWQLSAGAMVQFHSFDTTIGAAAETLVLFELGIGWGSNE